MSTERLAALALAAAALAIAGCGSSSKTETTATTVGSPAAATTTSNGPTTTAATPPAYVVPPAVGVTVAGGKSLSRAQWIAKGDAICAQLARELKTLTVKKAGELPRVLPQAAAYERTEVVALAKLVPPASMARDWEQFLSESLQFAEGGAKLAESAKLGDAITGSPLARATIAIRAHLTAIARHDGFKVCSNINA